MEQAEVAAKALVVEGQTIPSVVVERLTERMRAGSAFRAFDLERLAREALGDAGIGPKPAMRLADRLIQRYRRSRNLTMRREGRVITFAWTTT